MNITKTIAAVSTAGAILVASPALALAVAANAQVNANLGVGSTTVNAKLSVVLQKAISRADQEIDRRITTLNSLNADVQGMVKISASEKSAISGEAQTEVANLTALKAKIDADTDRTALRADIKSIVDGYRIYMLVVPQGRIEVASDRIQSVTSLYTSFAAKLQTRILQAQSAGEDVTSLSASLSDMNAKVADANTQVQAAVAHVASLQPDNGNQTMLQSNKAALQKAHADLKVAFSDLKTARQDAGSIVKALAQMHASASASSSATVSQ